MVREEMESVVKVGRRTKRYSEFGREQFGHLVAQNGALLI